MDDLKRLLKGTKYEKKEPVATPGFERHVQKNDGAFKREYPYTPEEETLEDCSDVFTSEELEKIDKQIKEFFAGEDINVDGKDCTYQELMRARDFLSCNPHHFKTWQSAVRTARSLSTAGGTVLFDTDGPSFIWNPGDKE